MKKGTIIPKGVLVLIIWLTLFSTPLSGQNMIGQPCSSVLNYHQSREDYQAPTETRYKDGSLHTLTYLHKLFKMELNYVFDEKEVCQAYSISGDFLYLDYLVKVFNKHYEKLSENEWLNVSKDGSYKIALAKNATTYTFYYTRL